MIDCLIIGGGPAGLTAAVYLARFRRSVVVVDAGESRAARIPLSHNIPGIVDGVRGTDLLVRHRDQAAVYGIEPVRGTVESLDANPAGGFTAKARRADGRLTSLDARTVLLATGVRDRDPNLPDVTRAILDGYIRHCPVCDAFEVIDENIGILGDGPSAVGEAIFMRTYSDRVTLLMLSGPAGLTPTDRDSLRGEGIVLVEESVSAVTVEGDRVAVQTTANGSDHCFDTLYSALGADARSSLTQTLGADHDTACRAVVVDLHQRTSVAGVWAAGDVVTNLNQISVAWGQAAVAATDIHNHLQG